MLSDMRCPLRLPFRTKSSAENSPTHRIFGDDESRWESDEEGDADTDAWLSKEDLNPPDAREKYAGDLDIQPFR